MPCGIIKLKYKGIEDKIFIQNPQINYYYKVYKQYINFAKYPYKLEVDNNMFTVFIPTFIGDYIGSIYLYIESNIKLSLNDLLEKNKTIQLYYDNILLDELTLDLINIYNGIHYDSVKYSLFKQLYNEPKKINDTKYIYYIPLNFPCISNNLYLPLYLLYTNRFKIKLQLNSKINLKELNSYYIIETIVIQDKHLLQKTLYNWLIDYSTNHLRTYEVNTSIEGVISTKIDLMTIKTTKDIFLKGIFIKTYNNVNIKDLIIKYNNREYIKNGKELEYFSIFDCNLHFNYDINEPFYKLYFLKYSVLDNNVNGFLNLNNVNNFSLQLYCQQNHKIIDFYIGNKYPTITSINKFIIKTNLFTEDDEDNPIITIKIYRNIYYKLNNNNTSIIVTNNILDTSITSLAIHELYNGYNLATNELYINNDEVINENKLYIYNITKVNNTTYTIDRNVHYSVFIIDEMSNNIVKDIIDIYPLYTKMYNITGGLLEYDI